MFDNRQTVVVEQVNVQLQRQQDADVAVELIVAGPDCGCGRS